MPGLLVFLTLCIALAVFVAVPLVAFNRND